MAEEDIEIDDRAGGSRRTLVYTGAGYLQGIPASDYNTDIWSDSADFFIEAAPVIAAAGAGGYFLAAEGGVLGGVESGGLVDTSLGRMPPISQKFAGWAATTIARAAGANAVLAKLIGKGAMAADDDLFSEGDWGDSALGGDGSDMIPDVGPINVGGLISSYGGFPVTQTGAMGGAVMAGAGVALRSLWGVLRGAGGRGATFVINGVKGRMADLWPAVRKYGPQGVMLALGIGADQLTQLLMQAPQQGGRRKRGRGISAADIRRAKRVIRFNRRLSRELGTNRGYARRSYRRSYPRRWY